MVVTRVWDEEEWGVLSRYRASVLQDEKALGMDYGDSCKTSNYLMPLN